ncbi:hypothetical protein B0H10DRAFT_333099 [Mycena sp. CBHHK59/15]|nr:hypothetical protein B0H10DRAFT_333099 [Mycena sp. CBHHK59/15]
MCCVISHVLQPQNIYRSSLSAYPPHRDCESLLLSAQWRLLHEAEAQRAPEGAPPVRSEPVFPEHRIPDPSSMTLTSDAILTSLNLLKESADVFPPLKSVVGGVIAVWNLAERVAALDEEAQS